MEEVTDSLAGIGEFSNLTYDIVDESLIIYVFIEVRIVEIKA